MATMDPEHLARPIETADDIETVLGSKHSFEELLDCVRLAREIGRWDLVDRSAGAAFAAIRRRHVDPIRVRDVTRMLVHAQLRSVGSYEDLYPQVEAIDAQLTELLRELSQETRKAIEWVCSDVTDLLVALVDGSPPSHVRVCSRLRRFERSDLGLEAVDAALKAEPDNPKALTTQGAAYLDLMRYDEALVSLNHSYKRERTFYASNTYSRYWGCRGRWDQALVWARTANELDPDGVAGMRSMAKAAWVTGDRDLYSSALRAHEEGRPHAESSRRRPDRYTSLLIARDFFREDQLDQAEQIVDYLLDQGPYGPARDLKLWIAVRRKHRGGGQTN